MLRVGQTGGQKACAREIATRQMAVAATAANEGFEDDQDAVAKEVFSTYMCRSVPYGKAHPGDAAEASSLRCVLLLAVLLHY